MADLIRASAKGNLAQVQEIVEQKPESILFSNARGVTALLAACEEGEEEIARFLLEQKDPDNDTVLVNINAQNKHGFSAIRIACQRGLEKIAISLVDAKADLSLTGSDGQLVLHDAVRTSAHELLDKLLANCSANLINHHGSGETPLHLAVEQSDAVATTSLLKHGADVTSRNHQGNTALHISVLQGDVAMCTLLLNNNKEQVENADGLTPIALVYDKWREFAKRFTNAFSEFGVCLEQKQIDELIAASRLKIAALEDEAEQEKKNIRQRIHQKKQEKSQARFRIQPELQTWLDEEDLSELAPTLALKRITLSSLLAMTDSQIGKLRFSVADKERLLQCVHKRQDAIKLATKERRLAMKRKTHTEESEDQGKKLVLLIVGLAVFFSSVYVVMRYLM